MSEICFNVWYWLDHDCQVRGVAARAYYLDGDEAAMGRTLMHLSVRDFRLVGAREPIGGACHYADIKQCGIEAFFAHCFDQIENSLPAGERLPTDKFFLATPLFDFGNGYEPAVVGNGFIRQRE